MKEEIQNMRKQERGKIQLSWQTKPDKLKQKPDRKDKPADPNKTNIFLKLGKLQSESRSRTK